MYSQSAAHHTSILDVICYLKNENIVVRSRFAPGRVNILGNEVLDILAKEGIIPLSSPSSVLKCTHTLRDSFYIDLKHYDRICGPKLSFHKKIIPKRKSFPRSE